MKWSDYYATGAMAAASGPPSIVTTEANSPAVMQGAGAAPFAWVGLMMALAALYIGIRAGAKLSAVG